MDNRRLALFFVLSLIVVLVHSLVLSWLNPRPQQRPQPAVAEGEQEPGDGDAKRDGDEPPKDEQKSDDAQRPEDVGGQPAGDTNVPPATAPDEPLPADEKPQIAAAEPADLKDAKAEPEIFLTMGSADPNDPYRMLVTASSRGAAIYWIELNSHRYLELHDKSGYLGELALAVSESGKGCEVRVVGPGTPAANAGLRAPQRSKAGKIEKPGDVITALDSQAINDPLDLELALAQTKPEDKVKIQIIRDGKPQTLSATLTRRPLALVKPERETGSKPSFLMTLEEIDGEAIAEDAAEINGLDLIGGNWKVESHSASHVRFSRKLPQYDLTVAKEFRLEKLRDDHSVPGYGLTLAIEVYNDSSAGKHRKVAYRLDGPTGLPDEGYWYANKISRSWGAVGMRDVVFDSWEDGRFIPTMISCPSIGKDEEKSVLKQEQVTNVAYAGVDAQYFSAIMIPQKEEPSDDWFQAVYSLRIGEAPEKKFLKKTNTSCRLVSEVHSIPPGKQPFKQRYTIFAGPKRPDLLGQYGPEPLGLSQLVYYGWFGWVSKPMLMLLHAFYSFIGNYGLAIILLTVLVRSCMFPLSRRQTLNAKKMQELQPEIKKITEKYKKNMEQRSKAQQELFRKHNYNPLGGCWVMFVQLPIFIGLYRSLSVDVELRQAPLVWQGFGWCDNLAAPDMLMHWGSWIPTFVGGWLGPYFNILPIVTVCLFLVQQKMFMPPATDEQTMMTQRMMKFMMLFMGVVFFKVASGLCIYFIASSTWGLAERKLLPKTKPPEGAPKAAGKPAKSRPVPAGKDAGGQKNVTTNGAPAKNRSKQRQKRR